MAGVTVVVALPKYAARQHAPALEMLRNGWHKKAMQTIYISDEWRNTGMERG